MQLCCDITRQSNHSRETLLRGSLTEVNTGGVCRRMIFSSRAAKLLQRLEFTATQFPLPNNGTLIVDARPLFTVHFPNVKSNYDEELEQENLLTVISIWACRAAAAAPEDGAKP